VLLKVTISKTTTNSPVITDFKKDFIFRIWTSLVINNGLLYIISRHFCQ